MAQTVSGQYTCWRDVQPCLLLFPTSSPPPPLLLLLRLLASGKMGELCIATAAFLDKSSCLSRSRDAAVLRSRGISVWSARLRGRRIVAVPRPFA